MDEQVSTSTSEKNTAPGLTAIDHNGTTGRVPTDSLEIIGTTVSVNQEPPRSGFFSTIGRYLRAYGATLLFALPILPIIVSAVTIGIYLANPSASGWSSVLYGAVFTYLAWMVVSLLIVPLTSPMSANAHSYGLLVSRLNQLITRLNIIQSTTARGDLQQYQRVALGEAFDKFDELNYDLNASQARLPWVMGDGYVNAWSKLHRAEEALVEVEPVEMVLRGALHDKLAISNSQMSNCNELLAKLRYAVKKLDPAMLNQFKSYVSASQLENENAQIQQLQQDVQHIAQHIHLDLDEDHAATHRAKPSHDPEDAARARITLREVRRALNEYRDHLWEGVLRARNNLLGTMFVTGLVTHILLCVAILAMTPVNGSTAINRATIISAVAYYMVGAIAGIFGRISQASSANIAVDDYGLSFAQIISRPLYSGLAGIGGVLISSTVLTVSTQSGLNVLQSIFTLDRPDFLILAAAFGLAPNLIPGQFAGSLSNQTSQYLNALRTSKTSTVDSSTSASTSRDAGDVG